MGKRNLYSHWRLPIIHQLIGHVMHACQGGNCLIHSILPSEDKKRNKEQIQLQSRKTVLFRGINMEESRDLDSGSTINFAVISGAVSNTMLEIGALESTRSALQICFFCRRSNRYSLG